MGKWLKIGFLAALLVIAGFFFGVVCRQFGKAYGFLLAPSWDILELLLRILVAALSLTVCAGLVATLLRPLGVAWLAFALSAVAMLVGWEFSLISGILVLIYFLVGSIYASGVVRDMNRRITFSQSSARVGQGLLLAALALLASGSLYANYAVHVEREGFTVPRGYIEDLEQLVEGQVGGVVPELLREQVLGSFRESFENILQGYIEDLLKPYEGYIAAIVSFGVLLTLLPIMQLLSWVPALVLSVILFLFRALGITRLVYVATEVQKLVLA